MILTQCACCAAPLPHLAKQCSRCKTRYCGAACQTKHWNEGGHDKLCRKIRKGGGAEQYNANTMYKEAVTVAAEACAEDTKGQTCYICTEAVHRHTKEGLVRGCACHTTEGFVHVSCLAEQAKILMDEAEENNLGPKMLNERWHRWAICGLCEQRYHGVVSCALGWACWKTYLGRPEGDWARGVAMSELGGGLYAAQHHEDALSAWEAELAMMRRVGASEGRSLIVQGNLANVYNALGLEEQALLVQRAVYHGTLKLKGEEDGETLREASNYACGLVESSDSSRLTEAKSLLRKTMPVARRVLGESHDLTLTMRSIYAEACYKDTSATAGDLRETVNMLEDTDRIARRVLGGAHPTVMAIGEDLRYSRAALARSSL